MKLSEFFRQVCGSNIGCRVEPIDWAARRQDPNSLAIDAVGMAPSESDVVRAGFESTAGLDAFHAFATSEILNGWRMGENSAEAFTTVQNLPNFLINRVGFVDRPIRLVRQPRASAAAVVSFSVSKPQGWQLARFSAMFDIDEQDVINNSDLDLLKLSLNEIGAACKRLIPDLIYSALLQNPALGDGQPCFRTERGNFASGGGSALDETSLDAGLTAIARQVQSDYVPPAEDGQEIEGDPVHFNLVTRHLIVPPGKVGLARRLARKMSLESGGNLRVTSESRLTSPVVDPLSGGVIEGNGKNWLLACDKTQAASVVLGALNGKLEPRIYREELRDGQWGWGYSVTLDLGVCVVDGKPLYWSQGE